MISAVLQLNEEYEFFTLEEETLRTSLFANNRESLAKLEPGNLYNLKLKIDIQSLSR